MDIFQGIFKVVNYALLISILLVIVHPVLGILRAHHNHEGGPEIWLASYTETDALLGVIPDDQFRTQNQYTNELISKNGSDYVVKDEVTQVVFACEADYPIFWSFPFPEQMQYLNYEDIFSQEYRMSDLTSDSSAPVNLKYKILLGLRSVFGNLQFLSLNITCSSVENSPVVRASIYVYFVAQESIENEGETLEIFLEPPPPQSIALPDRYLGPPLVLPCRPASPDVKLVLEKQQFVTRFLANHTSTKEQVWKGLPAAKRNVAFDPKVGFTVQRGIFYNNLIYGLYRCSVSSNDDDSGGDGDSTQFVLMNVTKNREEEDGKEDTHFQPRSILRGAASVHLELDESSWYGRASIHCCSGVPDKPPKLHAIDCSIPLSCQLAKDHIFENVANEEDAKVLSKNDLVAVYERFNDSSDCSKNILVGSSMIVVCQGENVDFADQYVDMFYSEVGGPLTNRSWRVLEQEKDALISVQRNNNYSEHPLTYLTRYMTLSLADAGISLTEKICLTVGRRWRKKQVIEMQAVPATSIYFGVAQWGTADSNYIDSMNDLNALAYTGNLRRKVVNIVEYGRDVYYVGEPLLFMCFGIRYFYASSGREAGGAHLRLNWENGTRTILESKSAGKKVQKSRLQLYAVHLSGDADMVSGDGNGELHSIFGRTILAQKGMTSVDCWMAHKNSSSWDKISRKIVVKASVAPRFVESGKEAVYYNLGEKSGHFVTCTVVDAQPFPTDVKIMKDGKSLEFSITFNSKNKSKTANHNITKHNNQTEETENVDQDNNKIAIRIDFGQVKLDHQGVYVCTATNVNGTARRTINVYVIGKSSIALPVSLGVAGILCLILLGLGVKHWWDKRIVFSLRSNHL